MSPAAPATAADSRARILDAAADSIAEDGVAAVRMAAIARRAGVSTALLHYHFATKDQLFDEVLRRSYESSASPAATTPPDRPAPERLMAHLEGCLPGTPRLRRDLLLWQEFTAMSPRHPAMAAATADYFHGDVAHVAEIVRDGVAEGAFAVADPEVAALAATALVDGMCTRILAHDPSLTLESAREVLARSLAVLLGASGPEPFRRTAAVPSQSRGTHRTREAAR